MEEWVSELGARQPAMEGGREGDLRGQTKRKVN